MSYAVDSSRDIIEPASMDRAVTKGHPSKTDGIPHSGVAVTPGNGSQPTPGQETRRCPPESSTREPVVPAAVRPAARRPPQIGGQVLIKRLSVQLLKTYNLINQRYYARKREREKQRQKARRNNGHDDENHNYIIKASEKLNDRYVVDSVIGKGSFGQVVKAYDMRDDDYVAVKIVKSKTAFFNQAQIEIRLLKSLQSADPEAKRNVVRMRDAFLHHNHQCIVFELLSFNLYELLRDTGFYGVSLTLIRKFARQLLDTLDFIGNHKDGVIHCDLKPENILLRSPRHSAIKVIDFGSACFSDERMYTYIQSRFYRSPEVLLGCPYNRAIDMWSLGCILVEMHTGKPLFNGSNEREQVQQQFDTLGLPSPQLLLRGKKAKKYFVYNGFTGWQLTIRLNDKERARCAKRPKHLSDILGVYTHGPRGCRANEQFGHTVRDYWLFLDLVQRMLDYNPDTRITPAEAARHPFFTASTEAGSNTYLRGPLTPSLLGQAPHGPEPPGRFDNLVIQQRDAAITDSSGQPHTHNTRLRRKSQVTHVVVDSLGNSLDYSACAPKPGTSEASTNTSISFGGIGGTGTHGADTGDGDGRGDDPAGAGAGAGQGVCESKQAPTSHELGPPRHGDNRQARADSQRQCNSAPLRLSSCTDGKPSP